MLRSLFFSLLFVSTTLSSHAIANIYKCKDASGNTSFSDRPCATGSIAESKSVNSSPGAQAEHSNTKEAYTKDLPVLQSTDAAIQACFKHVNTTEHFPDPATTRLLSGNKKWVSVKNVGARQMVNIEITSKNEAGLYVGKSTLNCLMMGDGVTVNMRPYELL